MANGAKSISLKGLLTSGIGGLAGSLTSIGGGIAAVVSSLSGLIVPVLLGGLAIHAGKSLWDNVLTDNAASKKYEASSQKYETSKSEVESLQSEYDSNKSRIQELNEKQNKSLSESAELSNLRQQNQLLGSQLKTKESIATADQKQNAADARAELEKKSMRWEKGLGKGRYNTKISAAQEYIDSLNQNNEMKAKILNNRSKEGTKEYKSEEQTLERLEKASNTYNEQLSELMGDISDESQSLKKEDGTAVNLKDQGLIDQIDKLFDDYASATGSADRTEDKLKNIFALSDYADLQSKLESIGKNKGSKGLKKALKNDEVYSDLVSELKDRNVSMNDLTDYIMAIAAPEAKDLEGIKENLKDEFSYNDKLYKFFKDKSDEDIKGFWDYYQTQGFDAEEYNWNKKDLEDNYGDYIKSKTTTPEESATFASKFKNSIEDTATDIDTVTDNFQSDMKNIQSAMESVTNGTFQNSDMADLIQQFPELSNASGDLKDNLQNLAMDKGAEAIGKIRDSVKDVTDPKQLAQADKYVQSIMDTMDMSDFDVNESDVRAAFTKGLTSPSDIQKASKLSSSLLEKYSGDEDAMKAIVQLSMDPSMADASIEEWESKIEDQEVQIKLNADTKELDNLSKEMTRLQTNASNTQTDMSNKAAFNQKVNEDDYNALIENGNAQIKNYDEQIVHYKNLQKTLKENNINAENTEQWKQWQDNIDAAQQSIENMKASQTEWGDAIKNLPITDITNLSSAITTAMSEMQSDTGLTTDSVKNLATQFSDLGDINIDSLYTRTAKGLQLNTDRLQDYMEQQNDFVNSDFENKVKDQKKVVEDAFKAYQNGDQSLADYTAEQNALDELLNRRNQYFARYQEAQEQFTDFQKMINAENAANAGDEYTTAKSKLDELKELYDNNLIGTEKFKKGAAYFSQNGFEDPENFIENYNHLKKYYTDDSSGPQKFLEDLNKKGLATYETLANGQKQWAYSFNDVKDAADQMGMSYESFQSILGRLSDYGFVNNLVTSTQDGEQQVDELTDDLITEKNKLSKLKANGATDQAIQDQEAVVDQLESKISGVNQAVTDYANGETDRKVQDLKEAKQIIKDSKEAYDEAMKSGDTDLAQKLRKNIQDTAKDNDIELTMDLDIDEDALDKQINNLQNEAREKNVQKYKDIQEQLHNGQTEWTDSEDFNAADTITKLEQAQSENAEGFNNLVSNMKKYNLSDLESMIFGNGAYESEDQGLRDMEDQIQGFAESIGLTADQANMLVPILEAMGKLDIEPKGLEETKEATKETKDAAEETEKSISNVSTRNLNDLQNSGVISSDVDLNFDAAEMNADQLKSKVEELNGLKPEIDPEVDSTAAADLDNLIAKTQVDYTMQVAIEESGQTPEELLKEAQGDSDTFKIKYELDDSEYEEAISYLENKDIEVKIRTTLDEGQSIDSLLSMSDEDLTATVHCDASQVDDVRSKLESMKNESVDVPINVHIDDAQFNQLVGSQTGTSTTINVDANTSAADAKIEAAKEKANSGKGEITVNANTAPAISAVSFAIASINSRTATINVGANTGGITSAINAAVSGSYSINVAAHVTGLPGKASGTMLSPAHASGTAYNVLNMKQLSPAHAGGNVALKHNEQALVNEVGTESIVRDGIWSLLPGGAHLENLKQGDIVFSASQTKDLLEHGKTAGHARAYAEGTTSISHAYARSSAGNGTGTFGGVRTRTTPSNTSGNSSSNSNTKTNNTLQEIADNTGSTAKSSGETADNTSDWKDPWENMKDWFERYTTRIDNKLDLNSAISENYQGNKSNKKNPFSIATKNSTLDYSIGTIKKALPNYQKQRSSYVNKAEEYANTIGLSQDLRKKVQEGRIKDIQDLSKTDKSKVEAYQTWYDKIHDVDSAIEDLKSKEADLWNQKFSNITDRYDALKDIYSGNNDVLSARMDYREASGQSQSYKSAYANDIRTQRTNQSKQNAITAEEIKKYKSELTKLGEEYGTQSTIYKQAQAGLLDLNKEYEEGKKAVKDFTNQLNEIKLTDLQNVIDRYDRASDKQSAYRDWKDATHYKGTSGVTQKDLKEGIKTNDKSISAMYAKRSEIQRQMLGLSTGSEDYQNKAKELAQLDKDILSTAKNTAELRQQMAQLRWDQYDKAIDKLDRITTDCENIQGMMDSDTFMSDDGSLTTNGLTNIALENQSIQTNQKKIATLKQWLNEVQQQYDKGWLTEEQFLSQSKQITSDINSAAKDIYSSQQNLIDVYINQITKENEYLQDNISKRKEALEAKKDYYDYDKTIKNKTKDINVLKAQIAALEGTTNAVAKAKLEQLKADLADKQDDLNDTKYDHKIDMESKGYDDLADQSDKALDSATQAVKTNADMQKSIISNMLNEVKANYKDVYSNITDIVKDSGAQISTEFNKLLTNIGKGKGNFTVTVTSKATSSVGKTNDFSSKAPGKTSGGQAAKDGSSANGAADENGTDKQMTQAVTATPKSISLGIGNSATVKIGFKPTNATYKDFTYEVSKKGIVSISKGKSSITVKGAAVGSVKITIKGHGVGCKSATVSVKVLADGARNTYIVKSAARAQGVSLSTDDITKFLNDTTGRTTFDSKGKPAKNGNYEYATRYAQDFVGMKRQKQYLDMKSKLSKWFSALPTFSGNVSKVTGVVTKHLAQKGKKATVADIQKAASILGYKDYKNVAKWSAAQKNALVSKLKGFGFANGGIVRNLIPANMNTLLGDAIIKNGDTGLISARPGETVLTEKFTNMLEPTITAMNAFTDMYQKISTPNVSNVPTQQQNIFQPEYNINITGMDLSKATELKKVIRGELDNHDKALAKEFKKFR